MKKLQAIWRMEPGDGTGCSIADAEVRNASGVCALLNCGKPIAPDAVSHGLFCKLCLDCEAQIEGLFDMDVEPGQITRDAIREALELIPKVSSGGVFISPTDLEQARQQARSRGELEA